MFNSTWLGCVVAGGVLAFGFSNVARSAEIDWLAPVSGSFQDGANWQGGSVPGGVDKARFDTGFFEYYTVTLDAAVANQEWFVGDDSPTLELGGHGHNVDRLMVATAAGSELNLINGTLSVANDVVVADAGGYGLLTVYPGGVAWTNPTSLSTTHLRAGVGLDNAFSYGAIDISGVGATLTKSSPFPSDVNFGQGQDNAGDLYVSYGATATFTNGNLMLGRDGGDGSAYVVDAQLSVQGGNIQLAGGTIASSGYLHMRGTGASITVSDSILVYGGASPAFALAELFDGQVSCQFLFVNPWSSLVGNATVSVPLLTCIGGLAPRTSSLGTGIFTVNGNYAQRMFQDNVPMGTLYIRLGGPVAGTGYDRLAVTGQAELAGTLNVSRISTYSPPLGQSFQIVTCGQRKGIFSTINLPTPGAGATYVLSYGSNALTITYDHVDGLTVIPSTATSPVGFAIQCTAVAQLSNAPSQDVSLTVQWSSDDPGIATVDNSGRVMPQAAGSTIIRANYAGYQAQAAINVLPLPALLTTERVSISSGGEEGNGESAENEMSSDGRFVAFDSLASNLVTGDTNGALDIFVRDRLDGHTTRVSVATDGSQANNTSARPSISGDGRFVTFYSAASNLVNGDSNGKFDVFVHDCVTGETERVSVDSAGQQGDGDSLWPAISQDGRFVAFHSVSTNLVPNDTNSVADVFLHDRSTHYTTRVSISTDGTQANGPSGSSIAISLTGQYVAFSCAASNLVANDTNGRVDVFLHDRSSGETGRVSVGSGGIQGDGDAGFNRRCISADGRFVAFQSFAANMVAGDTNGVRDAFLHDRQTGETVRVNLGPGGTQDNGGVGSVTITEDGRFVAFRSFGSTLVPDDTNGVDDVFVYNRLTGSLVRESANHFGNQANGLSQLVSLSADGRFMSYYSLASNLAPFDTNNVGDVFFHVRATDGDVNCDGSADLLDTAAFVQALLDPDAYVAAFPGCFIGTADINRDGSTDGRDIQGYLDALLN